MSSLLTDLKAYYNLEGNGNDVSGSGNNATPVSVSFSTSNGKIEQGGGFDGVSSTLTKDGSSLLTGNNSVSISGWLKLISNAGNFPCVINLGSQTGGNAGLHFYIDNSDVLSLGDFATGYPGTTISVGVWYHACCTYNSATGALKFYIDNVLYVNTTVTLNILNSNIRIGYWNPNNSGVLQAFEGDIDEVGYWQRELSAAEVSTLYNSGNGLTYPFSLLSNLKAYYKFQGNGVDSSGSGNGATVLNVSFGNVYGKIDQGGSFNGTTSRFTKNGSSMLTGTNPTSVSGWVRIVANTGNYPCPINLGSTNGTNSAFNFYIDPSDVIGLGTFTTGIPGSFIGDGNFHQVCATYDGATTVKLYIDGVYVNGASITMNWLDSNIRIGYLDNNDGPDDDQSFTGDIDEVGYWQRELSASEVSDLWNAGMGLTYPFGLIPTTTNAGLLLNLL